MANEFLQVDASDEAKQTLDRIINNFDPEEVFNSLLRFADRQATLLKGFILETSLSGQRLKVRTGTLRRSLASRGEIVSGYPAIRVGIFRGPAVAYARIQEEGGTIKPRRAKALAIPQEPVLTPAGVHRYTSPRDVPQELRFLPFRRGIAIGKLVSDAEAEALEDQDESPYAARAFYILMTSVDIPASRWLSDPVRKYIPRIADALVPFLRSVFFGEENPQSVSS